MAAPPIKKTGKGKKAQPKQASEPAQGLIGNTGGVYVPVPQPNLGGGPTKIPIVAESAEEKGFLEKKYELVPAGKGLKLMKKGKEGLEAAIKARKATANSGGHHF